MGDDDGGFDFGDIGALLFGLLVYREIREGRLDADGIIRAGCLLVLVVGAVLGGGLLLIGAFATPQYGSDVAPRHTLAPYATPRPAIVPPVTTRPTTRPTPAPSPTPKPTATPKPTPLPGIGTRVAVGGGWAVTVTKVERWRPAWYDEPGWRLLTVYVRVNMPAVEYECAWESSFSLEARSGTIYEAFEWQDRREPALFACADYHRPTTAAGWLTFEVRDEDAKGILLRACPPDFSWCDAAAVIRLE
jgi:hypothetical protein